MQFFAFNFLHLTCVWRLWQIWGMRLGQARSEMYGMCPPTNILGEERQIFKIISVSISLLPGFYMRCNKIGISSSKFLSDTCSRHESNQMKSLKWQIMLLICFLQRRSSFLQTMFQQKCCIIIFEKLVLCPKMLYFQPTLPVHWGARRVEGKVWN